MRAVRLVALGEPLRDAEVPVPAEAPDEVVVEVRAAGICRTDAHYRRDAGRARLPVTLGHEIAGVVAVAGRAVDGFAPGDRVALHYLVGCGCDDCRAGRERFCPRAEMLGKERDGGYAERLAIPAENLVRIPDGVSFETAAVMMCSSATALHALRIAGFARGESVLVGGYGGLGASAVEVARALGAGRVVVADVVAGKLEAARERGAEAVDGSDPRFAGVVAERNGGRGADVALDFAGSPASRLALLRALAPGGRLVLVALDDRPFPFDPYRDVLGKERRILGCSDHLRSDLEELMALSASGTLDLSGAVTRRVPLEAASVDAILDDLEKGTTHCRTVIVPPR
jgi:propanol-preferring alcohol dehydrogenase